MRRFFLGFPEGEIYESDKKREANINKKMEEKKV